MEWKKFIILTKLKLKKVIIIFLLLFIDIIYNFMISVKKKMKIRDSLNYKISKFAIIFRNCPPCGLFSLFITSLGSINTYYKKGYIPLINTKCYPNVFNGYNFSDNLWELFFEQPFGFTLNDVLKNADNVEYIRCDGTNFQPTDDILLDRVKVNFWHNFAKKFMPIKII